MTAEWDWSGKRSAAGRKLSEQQRSGEQACEKPMEREWTGARSRKVMERERSDERTKLAAQISLKGDASLLKLRKSILPDVKNKLSVPISNRR